jgi:hypothetical protein
MAEVELVAANATAAPRGGIVDRAVGWLERLPGTAVPWIIGAVAVLGLMSHLASWLSGETPVGEPRAELLYPLPYLAFFLTLIAVLDSVARSAFDEFRASLDESAETIGRLRADLTSIPDIPAAIAIFAWAVVINGPAAQDPTSVDAGAPVTGIALATLWFMTNTALALLLVHTLGQLRQVGRLQAKVARVNLLDPGPINAFSRLTAATAGGILMIGVLFAVVESSNPSPVGVAVELAIAVLAVAFFVLPLRGMHGRLSSEKGRLLGEANARLRLTLDRIHQMVDADDHGRADDLQRTETALLAERDLYLHISTWPWSTGTFRALASAVMLPIFIGVVLRLLGRVI